jgi:DNA-directed RNA polymerase subunit F
MIKNKEPISMVEAIDYLNKEDEKGKEIIGFAKRFTKINSKKGKEIKLKLRELNLIKLKEEDISKIIDLLPETNEELNRIFSEISLDEDEIKKILDTVKEHK